MQTILGSWMTHKTHICCKCHADLSKAFALYAVRQTRKGTTRKVAHKGCKGGKVYHYRSIDRKMHGISETL